MMDFLTFAKLNGFILEYVYPSNNIKRCATEAHPRSSNGAYFWDGTKGWVRDWSSGEGMQFYKSDAVIDKYKEIVVREQERLSTERKHKKAADDAKKIIADCKPNKHYYLSAKGFRELRGLVFEDETSEDTLVIPMRDYYTNEVIGVQKVKWNGERFEKKMLYGMRGVGAVLFLGDQKSITYYLCEGYATGLSIQAAIHQMRLNACVVVCFSDSNLAHVGSLIFDKNVYIYADNDQSKAGEKAAIKTGHSYVMSDKIGNDANDDMIDFTLAAVIKKIVSFHTH